MSVFDIFGKMRARTTALIDITPESVGVGYCAYPENDRPIMAYLSRMPAKTREGETIESATHRALQEIGEILIREGAPMLRRVADTGKADAVVVSISAPWQETRVAVESLEERSPFLFTQKHMQSLFADITPAPRRVIADISPIDVSINGYHVENPYGKPAERVSATMLISSVADSLSQEIASTLRALLHTNNIFLIASSSLIFQAVRIALPHERDYLILDAGTPDVSIALVRAGSIVAVSQVKDVIENEVHWPEEVHIALKKIGQGFPLPHSIIMIGSERRQAALAHALQNPGMIALWLSKDAPSIRLLKTEHFSPLLRQTFEGPPDPSLALMALYAEHA